MPPLEEHIQAATANLMPYLGDDASVAKERAASIAAEAEQTAAKGTAGAADEANAAVAAVRAMLGME